MAYIIQATNDENNELQKIAWEMLKHDNADVFEFVLKNSQMQYLQQTQKDLYLQIHDFFAASV